MGTRWRTGGTCARWEFGHDRAMTFRRLPTLFLFQRESSITEERKVFKRRLQFQVDLSSILRCHLRGGIETTKSALRHPVPLATCSERFFLALLVHLAEGEHGPVFFQPQTDCLHQLDAADQPARATRGAVDARTRGPMVRGVASAARADGRCVSVLAFPGSSVHR